jgi:hypothetical protein
MLIAQPRTGSTSIGKYFYEVLPNYTVYLEPFNTLYHEPKKYEEVLGPEDLFIKQIYTDIPLEYSNLSRIEFYDIIFKDFDVVIFLCRRDIIKQSESFSFALTNHKWEENYIYDEQKDLKYFDSAMDKIKETNEEILLICKNKNSKIYYYEDLFYDKQVMLEFLNEINCPYKDKFYKKYLDVSKKYRGDKNIKTLI